MPDLEHLPTHPLHAVASVKDATGIIIGKDPLAGQVLEAPSHAAHIFALSGALQYTIDPGISKAFTQPLLAQIIRTEQSVVIFSPDKDLIQKWLQLFYRNGYSVLLGSTRDVLDSPLQWPWTYTDDKFVVVVYTGADKDANAQALRTVGRKITEGIQTNAFHDNHRLTVLVMDANTYANEYALEELLAADMLDHGVQTVLTAKSDVDDGCLVSLSIHFQPSMALFFNAMDDPKMSDLCGLTGVLSYDSEAALHKFLPPDQTPNFKIPGTFHFSVPMKFTISEHPLHFA